MAEGYEICFLQALINQMHDTTRENNNRDVEDWSWAYKNTLNASLIQNPDHMSCWSRDWWIPDQILCYSLMMTFVRIPSLLVFIIKISSNFISNVQKQMSMPPQHFSKFNSMFVRFWVLYLEVITNYTKISLCKLGMATSRALWNVLKAQNCCLWFWD